MARITLRLAAAVALLTTTLAYAQSFPTRSVTVVVPFAAGGPTDIVARVIAQEMTKNLGQPVIVENRAGVSGMVGTEYVVRAKPDGHTLLLFHIGMATMPSLYQNLRFRPLEDFEFIAMVNEVPMTVVTRAGSGPSNFQELARHVKAKKDTLNYAHAGIGSASHLCGVMLMRALNVELLTVPYKGTAPAMNDLLGGRVDLMCDQTTNTSAHIKAGTVRVHGVTSLRRVPSLPNVPTLDEEGLKGFDVSIWHALYAPKGTPKPVIDRLVAAVQHSLRQPEIQQRFLELGARTTPADRATPMELERHLRAEIERWRPLLRFVATTE